MDRPIARRDVLHGMARAGGGVLAEKVLGIAALSAGMAAGCASRVEPPEAVPAGYPPRLTGLRGSAPGSFETAHALRDGQAMPEAVDTGEQYDLIVVGAGISGLAAAYFYRTQKPDARILILDNHDDFGGHARRNEFDLGGRLHLLNGGTAEIDSPRPYSAVADGLLRSLGVDVPKLIASIPNPEFFRVADSERAVFFDRETFGRDQLLCGREGRTWLDFIDAAPLNARARADVLRIERGHEDYLPGLDQAQKRALLARTSYRDYLRDYVHVDEQVLALYGARSNGEFAMGIDGVSALDWWGVTQDRASGMQGLGLEAAEDTLMAFTPSGYANTGGSYQLHFPDGNATIARLLVRALIPGVAPAGGVERLLTARIDYSQLDRAAAPVRLRLRSTVIQARNATDAPKGVRVSYVRDGKAYEARAGGCILACYNMIIPYLVPELPAEQKAALHELVKAPLVYTSVAVRNARAFHTLGVRMIEAPGGYHTSLHVNPYMAIGAYRGPRSPDEPTLLHLQRTPCMAGLTQKEQYRAGRAELLATPFETMERRTREQLGRMLGGAGFDPATDITAITINRWPHGYAPEFNSLFDAPLPPQRQGRMDGN